jgi:hypothetical protein
VLGPGLAIPDLEAIAGPHDDDLLAEACVRRQRSRNHDAPGGIKVGVVGAAVEEAL